MEAPPTAVSAPAQSGIPPLYKTVFNRYIYTVALRQKLKKADPNYL